MNKKTGTKRIIANVVLGIGALLNAFNGDLIPTEAAVPAIAIINIILNVIGKRKDK